MKLDVDINGLDAECGKAIDQIKRVCKMNMHRIGEVYIQTSRDEGSYKDRTGNLRAANGYGIVENGSVVEANTGRTETLDGIKQQPVIADMECVMGNGMDYASKVEGKGYDVSSKGALAAEQEARKLFKK